MYIGRKPCTVTVPHGVRAPKSRNMFREFFPHTEKIFMFLIELIPFLRLLFDLTSNLLKQHFRVFDSLLEFGNLIFLCAYLLGCTVFVLIQLL